jgi:hypothetical protein
MRSPSLAASSMSWVTKTMVFLSSCLEVEELLLEPLAGHRVDRAERLVHEKDRRIATKRPGHAHSLPLTPGELVGEATGILRGVETDQLEQLLHPCFHPILVPTEKAGNGGDVVGDPTVRKQATLLDHVADATTQAAPGPSARRRSRRSGCARSDGSMRRLIILRVVVLPHPEGPTSTQSSPSGTVKLNAATATASAP